MAKLPEMLKVRVSAETRRGLEEEAGRRGVGLSRLVREALREWLERLKGDRDGKDGLPTD